MRPPERHRLPPRRPVLACAPLRVAGDRVAEREADYVAERATRRIGEQPALRPAGGRLPAPLTAALAGEVGSLDHVRVHDDPLSALLAASVEARAITIGNDILLAAGEGGTRLLAHEAAHAAWHPQPAADVVHAKLGGTRAALIAQGGAPAAKGIGTRFKHWNMLLAALAAYEEMEAQIAPSQAEPTSALKARMLRLLGTIEAQALRWQRAHGGTENPGEEARENYREAATAQPARYQDMTDNVLGADPRDSAFRDRAQAIAMLLPRIREERKALAAGRWSRTMSLSSATAEATGTQASGGLNTVHGVKYAIGGGQKFSGFFKADKGFTAKEFEHELRAGIGQVDPNYGARSVAMTRLDQLFKTGVLAQVEFSTLGAGSNARLGTVIETAKGTSADKVKVAITAQDRAQMASANGAAGGPALLALEDPVLQRGLNKLQILDAICGQIDRHRGNYYVDIRNDGTVAGIAAIDHDMAFGKMMKTGGRDDPDAQAAHNYRGMPTLIDEKLAEQLLAIDDGTVRDAIGGLLSKEEVESTIQRLGWVRDQIRSAQAAGKLVKRWDASTLAATLGASVHELPIGQTSYVEGLAVSAYVQLKQGRQDYIVGAIQNAGYQGPGADRLAAFPAQKRGALAKGLITWLGRRSASGPAVDVLQDYYLQKLTAEDVIAITRDLIAFVLADATLMRDLAAAAGADEMEDLLAPVLKPQLRLLHRRAIAGRRRARAARRAKKAQIKPRRGVPAGSRT